MDILIISLVALVTSALTLFSGFGLGTLLMPVIALFFPMEIAIAMTAIVHLANNLFKAALFSKQADSTILLRFGVPAILFAFLGALLLNGLSAMPPLLNYLAFGKSLQVLPVKFIIGCLILGFVLLELSPSFASISLDKKYLPLGGAISGFFGGLSGHQGAFRSMFLLKAGLNKEQFVATSVMIAVMVDVSRLSIYGWNIASQTQTLNWLLIVAASLSAFFGAYFGAKLLKKLTIKAIQWAVSSLLVVIALGMMIGML